MAQKIIMPKQGLQMTEGTIIKWLVEEGGDCVVGQPLFEMETDKLTIEIEAQVSGKLLKIVRGEGETVPITETIAIVGDEGENINDLLNISGKSTPMAEAAAEAQVETEEKPAPAEAALASGERTFISPRAKMAAEKNGVDIKTVKGTGPDGFVVERDILNYAKSAPKATPLAKAVAAANDIPIGDISGTGARGKITKADVLAKSAAGMSGRKGTIKPFAGMRKVISERMRQSLSTAAQTSHMITVDMSEAARVREAFKSENIKISYNDIVSFVVCRALMEYPVMNSQLTEEGILVKDYVNLGVAVALDEGLIVPVVKDADLLSLAQLSEATRAMAEKAKNGTLLPDDYKGGSFTTSNLGMFGLDSFVAIINQPESGILAIGAIKKTPVVVEDEVVVKPMMSLTLSYDHRIVDGAPAAQFLAAVKKYLEKPYLVL